MIKTTTLYRPVGKTELELVLKTKRFPPRLPYQPIFYPVLDEAYAVEIARDWNTKDEASGFEGHVLCFHVSPSFLVRFILATAGGKTRREYWIPAESLEELNNNIVGDITLIHSFKRENS